MRPARSRIRPYTTRFWWRGDQGLTGCQDGQGIFVQTGYGTSSTPQNVILQNNTIRNFQKDGITVDGAPLTFVVQNNYVVGQGPTSGAGENGIQISDGATGAVLYNTTLDEIYEPHGVSSGILVYSSANVEVGFNTVGSTQYGIATVSDPTYPSPQDPTGSADYANIHDNTVVGTLVWDGIDVCSNNNTVTRNKVSASTESAIHLDSTCGSTGTNNLVYANTINEACAGILQGGTPNTLFGIPQGGFWDALPSVSRRLAGNTYSNVANTVLAGDVCTVPAANVSVSAFPVKATGRAKLTVPVKATAQAAAGAGSGHPIPVR